MLYKIFIDDSGSKDYINPYSREFIDSPPLFKDYPKQVRGVGLTCLPDSEKINWNFLEGYF